MFIPVEKNVFFKSINTIVEIQLSESLRLSETNPISSSSKLYVYLCAISHILDSDGGPLLSKAVVLLLCELPAVPHVLLLHVSLEGAPQTPTVRIRFYQYPHHLSPSNHHLPTNQHSQMLAKTHEEPV